MKCISGGLRQFFLTFSETLNFIVLDVYKYNFALNMVRVTTTVWYHRRGRDGASEPIITIDNKAFVLIIEGIIWPNVRGTCPHFSLNSPCSRNSWWGHSKGIRKPQHFTRFSTKVPFDKILSGNNLYHCSFNVMETSTLESQKSLNVFNGLRQWDYYFESSSAHFLPNVLVKVALEHN